MLSEIRLNYNDDKKITNAELFEMDENDFYDMMIEQNKKEPSDAEIINSYSNNIKAVIDEMREFNDSLVIDIRKNDIVIKNSFKFIMSIFNRKDKSEVLNLLICFICDKDYIFRLKNIIRNDKSTRNLACFIKLKYKINDFRRKFDLIKDFEKNHGVFQKSVLSEVKIINGEEITTEQIIILKELFTKYVWDDIKDENIFEENIEYIHKFCTSNEERKCIYPILIFRIFTKYRRKLFTGSLIITTKNLLNYNEYKIEEDNGKNFTTNAKYINLFFELCNEFCEDDNLELNLYMFEMCSNLGIWYWLQNSENTEFSYTYNSLLNMHINEYDTVFDDVSVYYDNDYINRGIQNEHEENGKIEKTIITEDDYIDGIIDNKLKEIDCYGIKYLQYYSKGNRLALKYVEEIKDMIINEECEELKKDCVFNRHMNFNIEYMLKNWCDWWINGEILKVLKQM